MPDPSLLRIERSEWTIYVCPDCGHVDAYQEEEPCEGCYDEHGGDPHPPAVPVPVRVVAVGQTGAPDA